MGPERPDHIFPIRGACLLDLWELGYQWDIATDLATVPFLRTRVARIGSAAAASMVKNQIKHVSVLCGNFPIGLMTYAKILHHCGRVIIPLSKFNFLPKFFVIIMALYINSVWRGWRRDDDYDDDNAVVYRNEFLCVGCLWSPPLPLTTDTR